MREAGSPSHANANAQCAVPGLARDVQAARIRTAGPAMFWPRSSGITGLAVPGSVRPVGGGRHGQKRATLMRTTVTHATGHAWLRLVWRSAPAAEHSQQPAAAAAIRSPRRARRNQQSCTARRWDFPTIAGRMVGRRRGSPAGCRQTPRWRRTVLASPDAPPRRRAAWWARRPSEWHRRKSSRLLPAN